MKGPYDKRPPTKILNVSSAGKTNDNLHYFLEASVGQRWQWMVHPNVFVLFIIVLISCWIVAASLMAEKTNVGVAVFVANNTSMRGFGSDAVLACPLLQSSVCLPMSFAIIHCILTQLHLKGY